MASQDGESYVCVSCNKVCKSQGGLTYHVNNACKGYGKRIAGVLEGYQELNPAAKKSRRLPPLEDPESLPQASVPSHESTSNGSGVSSVSSTQTQAGDANAAYVQQQVEVPDVEIENIPDEAIHQPIDIVRRSGRQRIPTRDTRYRDFHDSTEERSSIALLDAPEAETSVQEPETGLTVQSVPDTFGLRRLYYERPGHNPTWASPAQIEGNADNEPIYGKQDSGVPGDSSATNLLAPYNNESEFLLCDWFDRNPRNTVKSFGELRDLLTDPRFNPKELGSANVMLSMLSSLGRIGGEEQLPDFLQKDAGWIKSSVTISVPLPYSKAQLNQDTYHTLDAHGIRDGFRHKIVKGGPEDYTVENFFHRNLTTILRNRLQQPGFQQLHLHPYELHWKPADDKADVRVYGEMYSSSEFMKAHIEVQQAEPRPHRYPRHVIGMIYFSDGTKLSTFGDAQFWPAYMQFANDTKYFRAMPSMHLTEHIAYFQKLPPEFKSFVRQKNGGRKSVSTIMRHCKCDFFHAQWEVLLDQEFLDAYKNGLLVECYDGIYRLFFPRIFVYSADYLEKVLLATIKYLTTYPCPNCLVRLEDVSLLGTPEDMQTRGNIRKDDNRRRARIRTARNLVYKSGKSLNSKLLTKYLEEGSYTITQNAFSKKLGKLGFNFFKMFRTEMLHEWASNGEGKKIHLHLLRILDTIPLALSYLDERYRQVPSFGKDVIRKFRANVSELSFQAARDIEDIIQCALPTYEDLLPEPHNSRILDLLYCMADWHTLAKLRLHTDHTLELLDTALVQLGEIVREFIEKTCSQFKTLELKHEARKRVRRTVKKATETTDLDHSGQSVPINGQASTQPGSSLEGNDKSDEAQLERRETVVNINTSKFHALGDVSRNIREVGTTDSYSAEIGESEHRVGKRRYLRTDGREYTKQLAQLERREARLRKIRERLEANQIRTASDDYLMDNADLTIHHQIGSSQNDMVLLVELVSKHRGDPAVWDFVLRLKRHLLRRLKEVLLEEMTDDPSVSSALDQPAGVHDHLHVIFKNSEAIFRHNVFRVNYTAYDVRRQQDVTNPNTDHKDIMVLSPSYAVASGGPRFVYGRILGVYHCNIRYNGPSVPYNDFRRTEFLWVRWFQMVERRPRRLECLEFVPFDKEGAVGFLDPDDVIRAVHLIPRFSKGFRYPDRKGLSKSCKDGSDYRQYYVARFSQQDLYMRDHWGLGVGHKYSHRDAPVQAVPPSNGACVGMHFDQNDQSNNHGAQQFDVSDNSINYDQLLLDSDSDSNEEDDDLEKRWQEVELDPVSDSESHLDDGYAEDELDDVTYYARYGPG